MSWWSNLVQISYNLYIEAYKFSHKLARENLLTNKILLLFNLPFIRQNNTLQCAYILRITESFLIFFSFTHSFTKVQHEMHFPKYKIFTFFDAKFHKQFKNC